MTRDEALKVYAVVSAAWPAWKANEGTVALWVDMLADLDYEPTVVAVKRMIATDEGWPSIAKVRRHAAAVTGGLPPDPDEAWLEVVTAARRLGMHYGPPEHWSHRAVAATVASLGWERICLDERPEFVRIAFLKTYETVQDREEVRALAGPHQPEIAAPMRDLLGSVADRMALPEGDDE